MTLIIASMIDPLVIASAVWVFFGKIRLFGAIGIALLVAFLGVLIQIFFGVGYDDAFVGKMALVKFVSASLLLCGVSFLNMLRQKDNSNEHLLANPNKSANLEHSASNLRQKTLKPTVDEKSETHENFAPQFQEKKSEEKVITTKLKRYKKAPLPSKKKTRRQIQTDLTELKKLREDGLISDEIWEEKQKEILKDY